MLVVRWCCIALKPKPPAPPHLFSTACFSASLLIEDGQCMGFTVLLLLKGKVQVERQFLFKEVNFKYCCQTKKRDKTGACETVVCKSLQFSSSEKLLYSLCSSQSQEWIKHYPFYTGLPDFCSTHSVLMIKHIKVCFYFSTEMGIN